MPSQWVEVHFSMSSMVFWKTNRTDENHRQATPVCTLVHAAPALEHLCISGKPEGSNFLSKHLIHVFNLWHINGRTDGGLLHRLSLCNIKVGVPAWCAPWRCAGPGSWSAAHSPPGCRGSGSPWRSPAAWAAAETHTLHLTTRQPRYLSLHYNTMPGSTRLSSTHMPPPVAFIHSSKQFQVMV